ncbi:hypothetical protein NDU88_011648 [Pleurodeles waltl]|uniref:PiggyBac transposable element-derived protein domain-containing protein n=1 Tax=Pleurodeles waltl TaxID=8319 RepID=A0AAV7QZQ7_PLEWA|nr:hypothetical protein NDU88_011648 [Pleurodeles waltl]
METTEERWSTHFQEAQMDLNLTKRDIASYWWSNKMPLVAEWMESMTYCFQKKETTSQARVPHKRMRQFGGFGYSGFIPRFTWNIGENFRTGVKNSLNEFESAQDSAASAREICYKRNFFAVAAISCDKTISHSVQIRSPFGRTEDHPLLTHWPKVKIYNPDGIIPRYTGFVPGEFGKNAAIN